MGRWHAHACTRAGGRVVAVVDPDLEAAGRLSAAHHHAAIARSLQDVPADLRLQLVHVCSPPETHERAIREAFACGCSALVEKPAAPNAEATARLVAEGIASHLWIEPVHQVLFQRGVEQARGWLREMGVLRLFDYRVCSAGAEDRPDRAGLIADEILPHPLSLLDALLPGLHMRTRR